MSRAALVVPLLVLLTGCGGTDAPESSNEPEVSSSPTQAAATLADTCAELEAGLMEVSDGTSLVPPSDEAQAMLNVTNDLAASGDQETQNALGVLVDALEPLAAGVADGEESIDASASLDSAFGTLADRCSTAGSSAFQ